MASDYQIGVRSLFKKLTHIMVIGKLHEKNISYLIMEIRILVLSYRMMV